MGLGKACEVAVSALGSNAVKELTTYFYTRLKESFGEGVHLNGHPEKKLPNTFNISFLGYDGHKVLDALTDVAASTGSACHAGTTCRQQGESLIGGGEVLCGSAWAAIRQKKRLMLSWLVCGQ